jgi:homoserine dehydrogenase
MKDGISMQKIAIMGYGTVGSGTVELFFRNKEMLQRKLSANLDIKYILDLRKFPGDPYEDRVTIDFTLIENDPEITVAAELMGGVNPAYDYTKRLLLRGKSVITSNKELVARHGAELLQIAKEHDCNYFFEAAVGGAIPIIRPLHESLVSDRVFRIEGILNGTTNFILTKMLDEGMDYAEALKLSQTLGYAERNPAADVSGADSCRKICILASLAFARHVYPEWVYTKGIEAVTAEDAAYASHFGAKIKLIASAKELPEYGGKLFLAVEPQFVCHGNQISHVSDVYNAVSVTAEAAGELLFFGRGAGKLPTASAVLGDIAKAITANGTDITQMWADTDAGDFIIDHKQVKRCFYVRLLHTTADEIVLKMPDVTFLKRDGAPSDEHAFVTENFTEEQLTGLLQGFETAAVMPVWE